MDMVVSQTGLVRLIKKFLVYFLSLLIIIQLAIVPAAPLFAQESVESNDFPVDLVDTTEVVIDEVVDSVVPTSSEVSTDSTPASTTQLVVDGPQATLPEVGLATGQNEEVVLGDENKLTFKPLTTVSGNQIRIKLSEYDIPGLSEGEAVSDIQAVGVILGATTKTSEEPVLVSSSSVDSVGNSESVVESDPSGGVVLNSDNLEVVAENVLETSDISDVVSVSVENQEVQETAIDPQYISFESGSLILVIDRPAEIVPGTYTVATNITNPLTGAVFTFTQDFTWGVLTMNTNQDVYQVGQTASIAIGILDEAGMPVCGLSPTLTVGGVVVGVFANGQCAVFDSENVTPDYRAEYTFASAGEYELELTVDNGNGVQTMKQVVSVQESPTYIVARTQATRLYPFGTSPATLTVTFSDEFTGSVTERVPASFAIRGISDAGVVTTTGDTKTITWNNVSAQAGTSYVFSYTYDAPDTSPDYFTVGPVQLRNNQDGVVYTEARTWGIANDAGTITGNLYNDLNNNGTDDGVGEPGFRDVGVRVWNDNDNSNTINGGDTIEAGTFTNSTGTYSFPTLTDGNYLVEVYDPTNVLGAGAFTDAGADGILDTTIAGSNVTGQSVGFKRSTQVNRKGAISSTSTRKINGLTTNGPVLGMGNQFGSSLTSVGDLNNDGVQDLVVGDPVDDTGFINAGAINIMFMNTNGSIDSTVEVNASTTNGPLLSQVDAFGSSVANIGDLNGDGVQDLAVGAPYDSTGFTYAGAVHILFMNTDGSVDSTVGINASTTNGPTFEFRGKFGSSVANIGDLNNDGVQDLAVGAIEDFGGHGAIHILFMNTDGSIDSTVKVDHLVSNGPVLGVADNFGSSVTNIGDLNNDGVQDLAVGAINDNTGTSSAGAIHIMFMNTNGSVDSTVEINALTANGPVLAAVDNFGYSIASIGDLNNDGVQDLAVGAPNDDAGVVHVMFMNTNGSVDSTVEINSLTFNGPLLAGANQFGFSITNIGDLNNDGVQDISVGEPGLGTGGAIHIIYMSPSYTLTGNLYNDLNNNGTDDGVGEPGFRDVGVRVWNDNDNSNTINGGDTIEAGTFTNSTGTYSFPTLTDGNYLVEVYDPTNVLGAGAFTDAGADGILDTTIAGSNVTGQSVGFKRSEAVNRNGALLSTSTREINDLTSNGPVLTGNDYFGYSVTNIGDLNNDGVQDLAVGALEDDAGGLNAGAIHVMFMNTNGSVDSTIEINALTPNGPTLAAGDYFGSSIASIGDLNNDGVQDLVVGAHRDDSGAADAGALHVMFMNTDGSVDQTVEINALTPNGPTLAADDYFGYSVTNIGDLNNDGVQDLAVGAHSDDAGAADAGALHVMFMNNDGSVDQTIEINALTPNGPTLAAGDYFGSSVTNIGDLNNDGVQDLAVGAPYDDAGTTTAGAVHIIFMNTDGSVDATVEINDLTPNGPILAEDDLFGSSVTNIGDLNNDGVQDLVVGAIGDDAGSSFAGAVHIMFMNTDGSVDSATEINDLTANGPVLAADDWFGSSVTNIGDLNSDGIQDLVVGAYRDDAGASNAGTVHIIYMLPTFSVTGNLFNDLNNNGTDDGVGESGFRDVGIRVWNDNDNSNTINGGDTIAAGTFTNSTGTYSFSELTNGNFLVEVYDPTNVLGAGSFTDAGTDGVIDTTIAGSNVTGQSVGFKRSAKLNRNGALVSSSTVQINNLTTNGPVLADDDDFGTAVTNIGDLNNDGVQDLAVGAPEDDAGGFNVGTVHIMFMNTNGSVDSTVEINNLTANGPVLAPSDNFGTAIANIGDLNGDGVQDIAVGTPDNTGRVYLLFMNTDGSLDSTVIINSVTPNGPVLSSGDRFGMSVANLGDLNGDGVQDLAVGAWGDDAVATNTGAIHIMFLNTDGSVDSTVEINDLTANGPVLATNDYFGRSVANIGDLNGDGVQDIAVGSFGSVLSDVAGAVHIMFLNTDGSVDSTVLINDATPNGPALNFMDKFGASIVNMGDLNLDGVQDLVIGAPGDDARIFDAGAVHVLYMSTDGSVYSTVEINDLTANGPVLGQEDQFGNAVTNMGDLNGDGMQDLVVGAYQDGFGVTNSGAAHIIYMLPSYTLTGNLYHDLNNNGTDDGISEPGFRDVGVRVWNDNDNSNTINGGDTIEAGTFTNGTGTYSLPGLADGNYLVEVYDPTNVLGAGAFTDAGTDGILDTTIAGSNVTGQSVGFRRSTVSNPNAQVLSTVEINDLTVNGPILDTYDYFGTSITNIGDLNNDGVQDLAVGAIGDRAGYSGAGAIHIMFMNIDGSVDSTVEINDLTTNGPVLAMSDYFGTSITNIGDLNNDGVQDLAVGAYGDDAGFGGAGAIHIMFMNTNGSVDSTVEINDLTANGPTLSASDGFGYSITNIGDLNNDGIQDLVVGAPGDETGSANAGAIHIMFMNTDGSVDSTVEINDLTVNGPTLAANDNFGYSITNIGDLNSDGVQDLAVGAYGDDVGFVDAGAIHIMFMNIDGSVDSTVEINDLTANGPVLAANDLFGYSGSNIGDLNNDGVQDLAVGTASDIGSINAGAIHIMFMNIDGSVDSTVEINDLTVNGPILDTYDYFGTSITNIGDLNNDGVQDLAVGAPYDDAGTTTAGAIHIVYLGIPPVVSSGGGGGGSSGGGSSGGGSSGSGGGGSKTKSNTPTSATTNNSPATASTTPKTVIPTTSAGPLSCTDALVISNPVSYIRQNQNNPADVLLVKKFLNTYENANLTLNGVYDLAMYQAVIRWQEKYSEAILRPVGETRGTGYIFTVSLAQMKRQQSVACTTTIPTPARTTPVTTPVTQTTPITQTTPVTTTATGICFSQNLKPNDRGAEVLKLQDYLFQNGFLTATPNGFYGKGTTEAVKAIQLLNPETYTTAGLAAPNGFFFTNTRAVLNRMSGCGG